MTSLNGQQGVDVVAETEATNIWLPYLVQVIAKCNSNNTVFSNGGLSSLVKLVSFLCCRARVRLRIG